MYADFYIIVGIYFQRFLKNEKHRIVKIIRALRRAGLHHA